MAGRDLLATDLRLTHRELKQSADSVQSTPARTRHAIKRVRDAAHTAFKRRAGIFIPRIAVATAYVDSMCVKTFDRFHCARQFVVEMNGPSRCTPAMVLVEDRHARAARNTSPSLFSGAVAVVSRSDVVPPVA